MIKPINGGNDNLMKYLDFSLIFAGKVVKPVVFQEQICFLVNAHQC